MNPGGPPRWIRRRWRFWRFWPKKVRSRLTLLHAALFFAAGSVLLGITYGLVASRLPQHFDTNQLAKLRIACEQPSPDLGTVEQCKKAFSAGASAASQS